MINTSNATTLKDTLFSPDATSRPLSSTSASLGGSAVLSHSLSATRPVTALNSDPQPGIPTQQLYLAAAIAVVVVIIGGLSATVCCLARSRRELHPGSGEMRSLRKGRRSKVESRSGSESEVRSSEESEEAGWWGAEGRSRRKREERMY